MTTSNETYGVIGQRRDGSKLIVARHLSLPIAERAIRLLYCHSAYSGFQIERDESDNWRTEGRSDPSASDWRPRRAHRARFDCAPGRAAGSVRRDRRPKGAGASTRRERLTGFELVK